PGVGARECVISLLAFVVIAVGRAWRHGASNLSWCHRVPAGPPNQALDRTPIVPRLSNLSAQPVQVSVVLVPHAGAWEPVNHSTSPWVIFSIAEAPARVCAPPSLGPLSGKPPSCLGLRDSGDGFHRPTILGVRRARVARIDHTSDVLLQQVDGGGEEDDIL